MGMEDKKPVWDCGSSLYDSLELQSLMHQLDYSALAIRCMSMPHLYSPSTDNANTNTNTNTSTNSATTAIPPPRKQSKFSRSIQKLLRFVFRFNKSIFRLHVHSHGHSDHALYYSGTYSLSGRLESIPEVCEKEILASPEIDAAVGQSLEGEQLASETATEEAISVSAAASSNVR